MSRRWKDVKEDTARLSAYNDRARQMKNETEKPIKLGDDPSVSSTAQHEKTVAERSTAPKSTKAPEFVNT